VSKVTVIGLGLMGFALAEAFLKKPLAVTVWNRSAARSERLKAQGGSGSADRRRGNRSERCCDRESFELCGSA